jgi:hypothetical protein
VPIDTVIFALQKEFVEGDGDEDGDFDDEDPHVDIPEMHSDGEEDYIDTPGMATEPYVPYDCLFAVPVNGESPMEASSSSFTPANRSQRNASEQGKGAQSAKALFSKSMAPAARTAGTSGFLAGMLQKHGTGSHLNTM